MTPPPTHFNSAHAQLRHPDRLTLGVMTPNSQALGVMADPDQWLDLALAMEQGGFTGLWVRDVPLLVPQGETQQGASLDDPFLWLGALASQTHSIVLGTAAAVLPLRHPLHVAKAALTLDRLSKGRFVLGLGTGDRPEEFASFGADYENRGATFREGWDLIRSALAPDIGARDVLLEATGGFDVMTPPAHQIPMVVVGTSKQTVQWIAANGDGWATYHREKSRQRDRLAMWWNAVSAKRTDHTEPLLIQSMLVELLADPQAPMVREGLTVTCGRDALLQELHDAKLLGVDHVILSLISGNRSLNDVMDELFNHVIPRL